MQKMQKCQATRGNNEKKKTLNSSLLLLCYMMQEKGAFSRVAPAANFYGCADG